MNVLDLFCGAVGGWSCGLEHAGYHTVAACENVPWRRAVFGSRHPGCVMYDDVRDLTADRLRADLGYLPDVIVGSPPCQEISTANTKGEGITDDHLFWEWARLVFEVRPLWCAAENSPNAKSAGIDGILDALEQAGYAAWPCVVGADNAGANHRRKRLWLIAADAERIGRGGGWAEEWRPQTRNINDVRLDSHHVSDTHRIGQHGVAGPDRSGRTDEEPSVVDVRSYPDGRLASRARRHADGCLELGPREDGDDARHAEIKLGLRQRRFQRWSGTEPAQTDLRSNPPHSDREGCQVGSRLIGVHDEEIPPALRDIGIAWPDWNGGLGGLVASCAAAGFGAVDDGTENRLPAGLRNLAIAALGDAVIPQIPEAIGKVMRDMISSSGPR